MSYFDAIIHDAESGNQISGLFLQVNECPLCGFGIKPTILYSYYVNKNQEFDHYLWPNRPWLCRSRVILPLVSLSNI